MSSLVLNPYRERLAWARPPVRPGVLLAEPLRDGLNIILSLCVSLLVLCMFLLACPDLLDWYLIPVVACGTLAGVDMVAWFRRELDLVDPLGILGVFNFYFFYLAPLLTVGLDYHTLGIPPVPNWTDWVGFLSIINAVGLLVYLFGRRLAQIRPPNKVWTVRPIRFYTVIVIVLPVSLALQLFIFMKFGGSLESFVQTFTQDIGTKKAFDGLGYLFLVAEMFPMFVGMAFLIWARDFLRKAPRLVLVASTLTFFGLKMAFGGLRGSRGLTIWGMIWFVGAIHVWIRPVPRKVLPVAALSLIAFMYLYGFYKDAGLKAVQIIGDPSEMARMERNSGRTLPEVLLGDMARTDVQTSLLYQLANGDTYHKAYGLDYIQSFAFFIPRKIWPDRPPGKVKWGSEALFGDQLFTWDTRATYIYGLVGEGLLNFPIVLVPLLFLFLALAVAYMRSLLLLDDQDVRRLLLPICSIVAILMVSADLENMLFLGLSIAVAPSILVFFCTDARTRRSQS
jgi:hypothetical protein